MSLSSLQVLADNRNALLLAELGALLHDVGKCTSEFAYFVQARSSNNHDPYKAIFTANELQRYVFSPQRIQERLDEANEQYALHTLLSNQVLQKLDASFRFSGNAYTLREAIYFSRPRFAGNIGRPLQRLGEPLDLLAYCHGEGHVEKEEPWPSRTPSPVARYSAFGVQLSVLPQPADSENLTKRLSAMDWDALIQKHSTKELRELFLNALGDTRFPINEVTLWDWSYAVASLFKSELARRFLTGEWRTRDNLRWRLLRVNLDVLGLYAKATKNADLLGYQEAIGKACEAVKQLVEEEYPLGNEVYRDTAGIYFTFPDRDLFPGLEQEIRRRVEAIEPELAPRIVVDPSEPLKALLSSSHNKVRQELAQPMMSENLSPDWQMQWDNLPDGKWELCPVCRLRPMREKREACEHCEGRRQSRIELWERDPSKTIWLDEIADHNDRMALIVGKFGLDDWLSGDLVQTRLVRAEENDPSRGRPNNTAPARVRRAWQPCQRFLSEN
nr:CRISPR-associated protein Csx11 [Planctomycetota bacterium]